MGGFLFDVGRLRRCKACQGRPRTLPSMPRTLPSMLRTLQGMLRSAKNVAKHAEDVAKHAKDVARHAEVGQECCQACLGRCKHALGTHSVFD